MTGDFLKKRRIAATKKKIISMWAKSLVKVQQSQGQE